MNQINSILNGDNKIVLKEVETESIDLVYMDPPFFTQKTHSLSNKNNETFSFDDKFENIESYLSEIKTVLEESFRILKNTGSIFLHCDRTASHHLRVLLDTIFGIDNFQSEIIWSYKRWSNSKKGLLNSHQIIFFYSKTKNFKFNQIFTEYSATTNIDQILQDRIRDENGKSVYKTDENGNVVLGKEKKGVPLSDVWEIPYLNPKAKERCGYPTQKPVKLLQQIINLVTDKNDVVLDPFCGSGTTCVAAKSLERNFIGIDKNSGAVELSKKRLQEMIISESPLLENGIESYMKKTDEELNILKLVNAVPVQRNSGIDGFLKSNYENMPVPIKIQKSTETVEEAIKKLENASLGKDYKMLILIQTNENHELSLFNSFHKVKIIKSPILQIANIS